MFNNLINRKFDVLLWESSYTTPKPILTPAFGGVLDWVLKELLAIASGDKPPDAFPVAVEKFKIYLSEAKQTLKTGLVKDIRQLRSLSFARECGVRIALAIYDLVGEWEHDGSPVNNMLIAPISQWLEKPVCYPELADVLQIFIKYNQTLTDLRVKIVIGDFS